MQSRLGSYLDAFGGRRVLVIGDAILDHYIIGDVNRTSPEAPVPVLNVAGEESLPGGAANVARNLAAVGARVEFVSVRGKDQAGEQLETLLQECVEVASHLIIANHRPTTIKTRCIAQGQQMLRFDREHAGPIDSTTASRVLAAVTKALPKCHGVVISDYGKGLLTPDLLAAVIGAAAAAGLPVSIDPKGADYSRYRGATVITPNRKEAQEASGVLIDTDEAALRAAAAIQRFVRGDAVCVTLGSRGVFVVPRRGKAVRIPARAREVFDVTGAGDTFIALMSLALFSGATFAEAAEIGNSGAGIVVGRSGVATVSLDELRSALFGEEGSRKRVSTAELDIIRRSLARAGKRVVFTNGCFDLLNVRHIRLLEQARTLGDVLVVALNSDASVRKLKGAPRPLLSEAERCDMIAALPHVDYVTVFEGDTPSELLALLRPDILVKGSNVSEAVGHDIVEAYGGEVRLLDLGLGPTIDEILDRVQEKPSRARGSRRR